MSKQLSELAGQVNAPPGPKYAGIFGVSSINHRIRAQLGLTLDEYCVLLLMDQFSNAHDIATAPTENRAWEYLGMTLSYTNDVIGRLMSKVMLIQTREGKYQVSPRWRKLVPKMDEAFEQLYEMFRRKGNRAAAIRNYKDVLNQLSAEAIHDKCSNYMKYVYQNQVEWKYQTGLDNFLDPKHKKYDDHFEVKKQDSSPRGKL